MVPYIFGMVMTQSGEEGRQLIMEGYAVPPVLRLICVIHTLVLHLQPFCLGLELHLVPVVVLHLHLLGSVLETCCGALCRADLGSLTHS